MQAFDWSDYPAFLASARVRAEREWLGEAVQQRRAVL